MANNKSSDSLASLFDLEPLELDQDFWSSFEEATSFEEAHDGMKMHKPQTHPTQGPKRKSRAENGFESEIDSKKQRRLVRNRLSAQVSPQRLLVIGVAANCNQILLSTH
jgi:hypothetical protein